MKKLLLTLLLCWPLVTRAGYSIEHLEPSFWWAGMRNPNLQLLVHGDNVGQLDPVINYPGIELKKVHRVANDNYLFIDLLLSENVKPGVFSLGFARDGEPILSFDYQLRAREKGSASRRGFAPDDVIYLITPDRFANGDGNNDEVSLLTEGINRQDRYGRHGGDLQGIINHLNYIQDMGFTQVWLNPVLQNNQPEQSYHGYAITNFYQVDARYGSNALYRKLSDEARQRGIGLIMDVVLNHCGSEHWWMKDLPSKDWINNGGKYMPTSHRRESLHDPHGVAQDRETFSSGWFVPTMPDLNQRNPYMATYLIQNSIWWVEYAGLSGIRVDTYSYSDRDFLSRWTRRLMEEYPNFNIVGEEWSLNPSIVAYWQDETDRHDDYQSYLPSLMDFPLQNALVAGLTEKETWSTGLVKLYDTLAADFVYGDPYNLVVFPDNHDMDRIYTRLDENDALWRMAITYFLTTRGIPQIYYGTEIKMSHSGFPNHHGAIREDFPGGWPGDRVNAFTGKGLSQKQQKAQMFMRKLLNWRQSSIAVHKGELTHFTPENGIYVYFRHHEDDLVMVVLNKGEAAELDMGRFRRFVEPDAVGTDVMAGKKKKIGRSIKVPASTALVLDIE